ncbi:MAG: hypothetical protein AAFR64_09810 [Pseudomonadota bacterium]
MQTPFDTYLTKLMGDDDALTAFLSHPIESSEEAGLTKAERTVLRRVLIGASTNSTNGYAVVRPLSAYRQAVRVLQNVMHNNMGSALAAGAQGSAALVLYYSGNPADPGSYPYNNYLVWYGTGSTIGELMSSISGSGAPDTTGQYKLVYTDSPVFLGQGKHIIESFTIGTAVYTAPPHDASTSRDPFWFFSVNGRAVVSGSKNPTAKYGGVGESYYDYPIVPGDTVFWQDIAPDMNYGFASCKPSTHNHAKALV